MTRKVFLILLALVLALSVGLVACVAPAEEEEEEEEEQEEELPYVLWDPSVHGEVSFSQLEWLASPEEDVYPLSSVGAEEALYPFSNVGEVQFTFFEGAGDWLLDDVGGGWLNVVVDTTDSGGAYQWAVQNFYLTYPDESYLIGCRPSVHFPLGLDNETPIESLEAAVLLCSEPLGDEPEGWDLETFIVRLMPYLVGGGIFGDQDGGSAGWDLPLTIRPFVGRPVKPERIARIKIPPSEVAKIREYPNMCMAGAYARSLSYLDKECGLDFTDDFQSVNDMLIYYRWILFEEPAPCQLVSGLKNAYIGNTDLSISSEFLLNDPWEDPSGGFTSMGWKDLIERVMDALDDGCDVEVWVDFPPIKGDPNDYSHMAMVTWVDRYPDGSTTIKYVDDPNQGDKEPETVESTIQTDNAGKFGKDAKGSVYGFVIECCAK